MKSKVHPTYKTKYRVKNWGSYDRALTRRGDLTLWVSPQAIATWEPSDVGTRGGQRQTEGFLTSLFRMMNIDCAAPDHTTLSRRGQCLDLTRHRVPTRDAVHLIVDSTGLAILGEGEWAAAKHGRRGRRGWKKLHLGVDGSGVIVAHAVTDATVDDATTGITQIDAVGGTIASVTGDAAYDTIAFYKSAGAHRAKVLVPPIKSARVSRQQPRSRARDRTIKKVNAIGRRRWQKTSGYHRQARVENAVFRYKAIFGGALRARSPGGQVAEVRIACDVLNQMTDLGRPDSYAIGR